VIHHNKGAQQIFIYHRPQCHRLQQRQRIHTSTGPRLAATPQPLSLHRRSQAKSQSHVSCAITVSSDNRLQEVGKKKTEALKAK
jgi:hypothetical protein